MRYFRRYWSDSRGDANSGWGCSWWYFETDHAGDVVRQIEIYDHGPTIRYSAAKPEDEFGGLAVEPIDFSEIAQFEILEDEFDRAWNSNSIA